MSLQKLLFPTPTRNVIVQARRNGNARSVRERNKPENERVDILVENLNRVVEFMTKMMQNSEMGKNFNIKLPDQQSGILETLSSVSRTLSSVSMTYFVSNQSYGFLRVSKYCVHQ